MAYEVARVHGLILSHIQDDEKESFSRTWSHSKSKYQLPRLSPDTPFLFDAPSSELNRFSESSPNSSLDSRETTETESDEEDIIAGIAEQIAQSMLEDDEPTCSLGLENGRTGKGALTDVVSGQMSTSPQRIWGTNSAAVSWSESLSSSKQSSQVSSPPFTPHTPESDAWDLLNAAAGKVVRLKMDERKRPLPYSAMVTSKNSPGAASDVLKQCSRLPQQSSATAWRPQLHVASLASSHSGNPAARSGSSVLGSKDRIMEAGPPRHVPRSWSRSRDEERKVSNYSQAQHRPSRNDGVRLSQGENRSTNGLKVGINQKVGRSTYGNQPRSSVKAMDCNGFPQRPGGQGVNAGSGMRAVFLGSAGSGRESGGTGVFFPRCIGGGSEHRRKPACSTVLLPSRIVQVLNLNVEDMRSHPSSLPAIAGLNNTGAHRTPPPHMYVMELTPGPMKYEARDPSFARKSQGHYRHNEAVEISLPTEWTY